MIFRPKLVLLLLIRAVSGEEWTALLSYFNSDILNDYVKNKIKYRMNAMKDRINRKVKERGVQARDSIQLKIKNDVMKNLSNR